MADEAASPAKQRRRRRRRRRKFVVGALVAVLLIAGAGTAWALQGPDGPQYRLASVERTDVRQTVDADGTLAAGKTATAAFTSGGTVSSVRVAVGDPVGTGQVLATIDPSALEDAITSARTTLDQAKQKLADDEEAQASGTAATTTATTSGTSNWSAGVTTVESQGSAVLVASVKSTATTARSAPAVPAVPAARSASSLTKAQAAVVVAQQRLDAAITGQDTYVKTLITGCAAGNAGSPTTTKVTGGATGEVSGSAGKNAVIVTLLDSGGNAVHIVRLPSGGDYSFSGLTAGAAYSVQITLAAVVNTDDCTAAVRDVQAGQKAVDAAHVSLDTSLTALAAAIKAQSTSGSGTSGSGGTSGSSGTSGSGSGSGGTSGSGSGSAGSRTGSRTAGSSGSSGGSGPTSGAESTRNATSATGGTGSASGSTSGTTITAEQIAADTKAIDAAKAILAVARQSLTSATLRSPISGTVGAVAISKGAAVSASSSSTTITVVGTGAPSIALSISLADIDLIRAGQPAEVTVDGRSTPLPATVSYVGVLNSSSSTGSSSTYPVTVELDRVDASLYDGMGASVSIETGSARGVLAVPISAVHTSGTRNIVDVYANATSTAKRVTLGVVGDDIVQIKSGLGAGDQVILADVDAAIPTSDTSNRRRNSSSLSGLTGGTGGGPPAGGGPGGR